jgi:sugar/nucleoside kinase (ribokinase family)
VSVDVACVGSPFLDLIFRGLPAIPMPGEEQIARELVIVPGAIANVAYGLRRLGLDAVVVAPIGRDPAGRLLADLMAEAGVRWVGEPGETTPVSVALPAHGDRAFVTADAPRSVDSAALVALDPRAVVVDLPNVEALPPLPVIYGVLGDPEVQVLAGNLPASFGRLRALILNEREARALAEAAETDDAGRWLAALGTTVVVTCGREGALAAEPDGRVVRIEAPPVQVDDPTGAGDLFTAAYVWADLAGRSLEDRLALATTYASLSLERATNRQKGITLEEFRQALADRGRAELVEEA